jgi:hypothetical protein
MSKAPRVEIEARLFVLSVLGEMKQAGELAQHLVDQTGLRRDLLRLYPLERWHEQGLITEEQVAKWVAQALALLTAQEGGDKE